MGLSLWTLAHPTDDRSNFFHISLGEEDCGHVVNKNGGKDKFYICETTRMVKLVCLNSSKLSFGFVDDEL